MNSLIVLVIGLGAAGLLPAVAAAGLSPVVVFLAPLTGAVMAAVAAVTELGVGGSLAVNYAAVAVIVNLAVIARWLVAGRSLRLPADQSWLWSVAAVVVVIACLALPVRTLHSQMIGPFDPNHIWLTHALMVYGGHHDLLTGLQNVAYRFSNPDYPPLVPAAGALAFMFFGPGDLHLAVEMTVLLTACALGVVGTGIAIARRKSASAIAAAGAVCLVGFAVSAWYGIDGSADLMWAAAGAGAVIWGLVLPQSTQALRIAWICAAAASLTKNEGLATALVILALIALRYRPLRAPGPKLVGWAERAAFVVVPALPGLAWAGLIRLLGIHDSFFKAASPPLLRAQAITSPEPPLMRAQATIAGMAAHLAVAPVALAVLLAGSWFLRGERKRAGLGNPVWLWLSCLGSLAVLFATYVVGGFNIHWWLRSSIFRTTIFAQVVLYADLAIWLVLAVEGAFSNTGKLLHRQDAAKVADAARDSVPPSGIVDSQPRSFLADDGELPRDEPGSGSEKSHDPGLRTWNG